MPHTRYVFRGGVRAPGSKSGSFGQVWCLRSKDDERLPNSPFSPGCAILRSDKPAWIRNSVPPSPPQHAKVLRALPYMFRLPPLSTVQGFTTSAAPPTCHQSTRKLLTWCSKLNTTIKTRHTKLFHHKPDCGTRTRKGGIADNPDYTPCPTQHLHHRLLRVKRGVIRVGTAVLDSGRLRGGHQRLVSAVGLEKFVATLLSMVHLAPTAVWTKLNAL